MLLPGQSEREALGIAETIRAKVQGWSDDPAVTTVSIGIASVTPMAALDWPQLVHAADQALYAAKAAGRNRCALAKLPDLLIAA